jgi:hypothetical protein
MLDVFSECYRQMKGQIEAFEHRQLAIEVQRG